jgi:hypothetical protein
MYFEEFAHDPGFAIVELDHGRQATHRWETFPAQPRCRIKVTAHELTPQPFGLRPPDQDPTSVILERVHAQADADCLTTLRLEGTLVREVYTALDLVRVQEVGASLSFFFDVDTSQLELEDEFGGRGERGVRLSQVEELQYTAAAMREAAQTAEERRTVELAMQHIMAQYSRGEAPA